MKLKLKTDRDGYIIATSLFHGDTEVPDDIASKIIVGVSKLVGGELYYRISFETDADGYLTGYGTDPSGDQLVLESELEQAIPGATKLIDGHLAVDQAKANELAKAADMPVPDAQDLINAQMMKTTAQLMLTNAALMKQVATLEAKTNG
ncbi:hypothetical protein [Lacticaseibacillus nasuensis]|uniref:hypothetical protein n=1 Tax=Lacticaseibacillus nasuensis TaxID=944671 RepID=UPI002246EF00|nr:hypothetical protein [Lacticaseibacillus nasuensis]MCX2455617.1 hypothetical protein [Lacticaseibacillus nasuensis]